MILSCASQDPKWQGFVDCHYVLYCCGPLASWTKESYFGPKVTRASGQLTSNACLAKGVEGMHFILKVILDSPRFNDSLRSAQWRSYSAFVEEYNKDRIFASKVAQREDPKCFGQSSTIK
jgi:hypothetical protein